MLKQTILDQQLKIQELEAKVVVIEKCIERIEKVERRVCEVDGLSERIADLQRVCDDNEQINEGSALELTALKWKRMLPKVVATVLRWSKKCSKKILD